MLDFLGPYTRYTVVYGQETITVFFYLVALTFYKKKRPLYILRIALCFIAALGLSLLLSLIRTNYDAIWARMLCALLHHIAFLGTLFVCYREKVPEIALCYVGIIAAKNMSGQIFALSLNIAGVDDLYSMSFFGNTNTALDWLIYWSIHAVLLFLVYLFLRKRERLEDERSLPYAITLAASLFLLVNVLGSLARYYQPNDFSLGVINKILLTLIYAFYLLLRSSLLFQSKTKKELEVTESLLHEEKKHYLEMKTNIDAINIKCHDLKHHLNDIEGKLTTEEVEQLRTAIEIYDSSIKTGNETLDTVLYQKRLESEKQSIPFKYLADGSCLNALPSADIYSLLSNALNNAFEASLRIENKDDRQVSLNVYRGKDGAHIEVNNAYNALSEESLGTSKQDKQHHGYGMRSMEYLVKRHDGTMSITRTNGIFMLEITLPLDEKSK